MSEQPDECVGATTTPRDFALTLKNWKDLVRVNKRVNETIKPLSDLEHWGVVERWSYPADGYGDCEAYVLLKRRILIQSGWPRETLLVTVVRDKKGKGHAVLTVTTDKGDYILDNETEDIRLWWKTGLPFRQTPIAVRPQCVGLAGQSTAGSRHSDLTVILSHHLGVPTPPSCCALGAFRAGAQTVRAGRTGEARARGARRHQDQGDTPTPRGVTFA